MFLYDGNTPSMSSRADINRPTVLYIGIRRVAMVATNGFASIPTAYLAATATIYSAVRVAMRTSRIFGKKRQCPGYLCRIEPFPFRHSLVNRERPCTYPIIVAFFDPNAECAPCLTALC